jgi:hypothetical protein
MRRTLFVPVQVVALAGVVTYMAAASGAADRGAEHEGRKELS